MRFRKNKHEHKWIPLDKCRGEDGDSCYEISTQDLNLSGLLDRIDLQSAIDVLPNGYKSALVLHDIQGYDHTEIAEMSGHSIGNFKSQLPQSSPSVAKAPWRIPKKEIPQDLNRSVLAEIANSSAKGMR